MKRNVPETETTQHAGNLSIPLQEPVDIQKNGCVYRFPFTYRERSSPEPGTLGGRLRETAARLLFVLTID